MTGLTGTAVPSPRWHSHSYNRAALYRIAEGLSVIPRGARLAIARGLGRIAEPFMPRERLAVRRALEIITGASGARLARLTSTVFRNFAMCFSDLVSTNRRPPEALRHYVGTVSGAEHVDGLSGGIVSMTAHIGNWELAGRLLAGRAGRRTHVVVEPDAPELGRWVRRDGNGMRFVARAAPAIGIELLAALRRGEVVALQGDRALGTRGDVRLPFFGRPAAFPLGPFLLARAAGASVVPAFCLLDASHRYRVHVAKPIGVERGDEEAAAAAWVGALEDVVREHPTQWFNFFDVWSPRPAPAGPPAR
jgi:KDO2-lipid IV(A) lauroyltransferase